MALRVASLIVTLALPCHHLTAQSWLLRTPTSNPSARANAVMAYDSHRGRAVLFGGRSNGRDLGDTWEWDGDTWIQVNPRTSPPARHTHAMCYDSARRRVVLFGGGGSSRLADTWEYDGSTWRNVTPASGNPPVNSGACMAFDGTHTVLFGGTTGPHTYINETWRWDGSSWTKLRPAIAPPKRAFLPMSSDAGGSGLMVFGGTPGRGSYSDTWTFDGTSWKQLQPATSPPGRGGHSMAFDSKRDVAILFGGVSWPSTFLPADTWTWDGSDWNLVSTVTSPSKRWGACMVFDSKRNRTVLFGGTTDFSGSTVLGDTWEFHNDSASFLTFGTGCASTTGKPVFDSPDTPKLGSPFQLNIKGFLPKPQGGYLILGMSDKTWGIIPLPLSLSFIQMPNCSLHVSLDSSNLIVTDAQGNFSTTFSVPSSPGLLGTTVFGQAWAPDPGSNTLGVATTNAFKATLGR